MDFQKECIIVIPVYKPLEVSDRITINQAIRMTQGIDKVFIMPDSFTADESFTDYANIPSERFDNCFFANILGYNRLMLNVDFYKRFSDYKYLLIHQTDVFLFKPDLLYWCEKNYDYIGAPWLKPHKIKKTKVYSFFIKKIPWLFSTRIKMSVEHCNNVGNGGLSLRKIETFVRILESSDSQNILNRYLEKQLSKGTSYNEDVFWSLEAPRLYAAFKKPDWREAIYFSIEHYPSYAYSLMDRQLPFGCHKPLCNEPEFWGNHIPFIKPERKSH